MQGVVRLEAVSEKRGESYIKKQPGNLPGLLSSLLFKPMRRTDQEARLDLAIRLVSAYDIENENHQPVVLDGVQDPPGANPQAI